MQGRVDVKMFKGGRWREMKRGREGEKDREGHERVIWVLCLGDRGRNEETKKEREKVMKRNRGKRETYDETSINSNGQTQTHKHKSDLVDASLLILIHIPAANPVIVRAVNITKSTRPSQPDVILQKRPQRIDDGQSEGPDEDVAGGELCLDEVRGDDLSDGVRVDEAHIPGEWKEMVVQNVRLKDQIDGDERPGSYEGC